MDGAVDAAASAQRPIGGVDDGVHLQPRNVTQENPDAIVEVRIDGRTVLYRAVSQGVLDEPRKRRDKIIRGILFTCVKNFPLDNKRTHPDLTTLGSLTLA